VVKMGTIGLGKVTEDQHLPAIASSAAFALVAASSRRGIGVEGGRTFRTPAEMYAAVPELEAVAVCTPPQLRRARDLPAHRTVKTVTIVWKEVVRRWHPGLAALLRDKRSLVDAAPLRLVADSFLIGRRIPTDPFDD
jgi:hypothetical protein